MSDAPESDHAVKKVHLGFAPNRVKSRQQGLMIAFAIDEQRRFWGWFQCCKHTEALQEIRIVQDGDLVPSHYVHVGSEFETLEAGGLHGYHAYRKYL